ncbi:hypothetical protein IWQ62_005042 [Dispira parvispora]|uniref:Uncharacterized protein n=1 Tax=Dispira parvispora TaxID=1520584 RepID=A0A9W8E4V8_9FUNG|nr:hypothetical protein IWQ62_005042 [Dispira parvispora]
MKGKHPYKTPWTPPIPRDIISLLPREVALRCFRHLPLPSLIAVSQTCRQWRQLVHNNRLWYTMCRRHEFLKHVQERYPNCRLTPEGWVWSLPHNVSGPVKLSTAWLHPSTTCQPRLQRLLNCRAQVHWYKEFRYYYTLETRWLKGRYTTRDYRGHKDVVLTVRLDPVRRLMFSGSRDGTIKVWNLDNHRCVKTLKGHTAAVACLDYDSQTRVLVTGSWDGTVQIWRMSETMAHIMGESDHTGEEWGEYAGSRSSYGAHLRSRQPAKSEEARDGSLPRDVWAHFTGQTASSLPTSTSTSASSVSTTASTMSTYSPSALGLGNTAFPANDRSRPRFTCTHILDHGEEVICLRYKGNEIAVGTGSGLVQLWDATTGNCLSIYNFYTNAEVTPQVAHDASVIGCVDMDSRYIYAGVGDSIAVFDRVQESILSYVHIHSSSVTALKLDASFFVSGAEDSSVLIWHRDRMVQPSSTRPVQRVIPNCLGEETRESESSTVTPTTTTVDQQVAPSDVAPLLLEHDPRTSQLEQVEPHMLHGHLSGVRCLQTHGNILCTGSYDTTIRVWSIKKDREECILKLKGHIGDVNTIDMTEDLIVSGSDEGVIKVWDFRSKANLPQPFLMDDQGTPIPVQAMSSKRPKKLQQSHTKSTVTRKRPHVTENSSLSPRQPSVNQLSSAPSQPLTWLEACTAILTTSNRPLTCMEVYDRIRESQFASAFQKRGKTPLNTLNRCLHQHSQGPSPYFEMVDDTVPHRFVLCTNNQNKQRRVV